MTTPKSGHFFCIYLRIVDEKKSTKMHKTMNKITKYSAKQRVVVSTKKVDNPIDNWMKTEFLTMPFDKTMHDIYRIL